MNIVKKKIFNFAASYCMYGSTIRVKFHDFFLPENVEVYL